MSPLSCRAKGALRIGLAVAALWTVSGPWGLPAGAVIINFTPDISVTEEYTDNIFLDPGGAEEDFITSVSPGFTLEAVGKNTNVQMNYALSHSFYAENSENNAFRHNAGFDLSTALSRHTTLNLRDAFLRTEDPLAGREEGEPLETDTTVRRNRETYYRNNAAIGLSHRFGESDTVDLGYAYDVLENDDPDVEDSQSHNPTVTVEYWIVPNRIGSRLDLSYTRGVFFGDSEDFDNWEVAGRGIYRVTRHLDTYFQYAHEDMRFEGEEDDYQVYNPSIGLDYTIDPTSSLALNVGYFFQDNEDQDEETGISASLGYNKTLRRFSFNLNGSGGVDQSYFTSENLGTNVYYQAGLGAGYRFTSDLTGTISATYRDDQYSDIDPEREDETTRFSAGLEYEALKWLSFQIRYSFNSVESTTDENAYDENRVFFGVTLLPSQPYRISK